MGQGENAPEASGPERFDTALKALINAVGLGDASPTAWGLGAVPIADLARTAVVIQLFAAEQWIEHRCRFCQLSFPAPAAQNPTTCPGCASNAMSCSTWCRPK